MKLTDINLCDLDQFETGSPHAAFKVIREQAPVWFHPANELAPEGEGFWVISKNEDAREILKNHEVFSSETGKGAREGGGTTLHDMSTEMAAGTVLSMMDPPKHDDIRGLVNQGFFPKTLKELEPQVLELVTVILDNMGEGEIDFLNKVAAEIPLQVICTMGGLPKEDWHRMVDWADAAIQFGAHDPDADEEALIAKLSEMGMYAFELIQKLKEEPDDSVMSAVVHAEITGEDGKPRRLDDLETIRFFNLLITGGTETTRNAMAGGLYALLQHPDQYHELLANPEEHLDNTVEEILRWTSPVHFNRRTASEDFEFRGQHIKRGEKVTIWYPSANMDEDVFEQPEVFNIFREKTKNKHVSFGYGIHHCLGAALARMEIRMLLEELLKRFKNKTVETVGELKYLRSNRHQGLTNMKIKIS